MIILSLRLILISSVYNDVICNNIEAFLPSFPQYIQWHHQPNGFRMYVYTEAAFKWVPWIPNN